MDLTGCPATIVGGGIGGMAAALALARAGALVTVHEAAPALTEVGAGLQVSANGQAALRALGLADAPAGAVVSTGTVMRGHRGRAMTRLPPPAAGATWYVHRADLLSMLTEGAQAAGARIVTGSRLAPGEAGGDLVVAADGSRSAHRVLIDGPAEARFAGQVAWRALVPAEGTPAPEASLTMGPGAHVVSYPLRGGRLMNLVAVEERRDWTEEGWRLPGDPAEFRRRFSAFGGPLGDLIARVEEVNLWALHLRPVAERWQDGRTALLGDAAHPTLPFAAQGACLALEDAAILGRALALATDIPDALRRYEAARRTRAARVVRLAGGNAWRFHVRWPLTWGRAVVLRLGGGLLARGMDAVYDHDPATVAL
ncbi:monooxygenase [Wenxinia marina]|uniref:FAD-dependent monooxygenase n=1 Tax=Wenxinia marina TaxID=390641 RepID=UPI00037FBB0D|nr:FAD-dependent monooxygenase [Wenxinia marina]GGL74577.1 monooxygenase [Wenxinia marina]